MTVQIRPAQPRDALDIARLVLLSAEELLPAIFGPGILRALEEMAAGTGTLFSHRHAWIAESADGVSGMLLGYPGAAKASEDPRTGLALLGALRAKLIRRLPALLRMQSAVGRVGRNEFYISSVAVYPAHRGRGIGTELIARAREEARRAGAAAVVLDVETDNPDAERLYQRLGFRVKWETPRVVLGGTAFGFRRLGLSLGGAPGGP